MKKHYLGGTAILGIALFLTACDSGGGSSGSSADLTGVWRGVFEYAAGPYTYHEMLATIDGTTITDLDIGSMVANDTGSVATVQSNIYSYTLTSGGEGGFMIDSAAQHAGIVDIYTGDFAVVEKGASSLPQNYVQSDIVGTWSGYSVNLDSFGDVAQSGSSSATVTCPGSGDCSFSGTDVNGSFSGSFTAGYLSLTAGWYGGTFSNTIGSGTVYAFLSPDKTFAAAYACQGSNAPPSIYCTYSIWNKQ